MYIILFSKTSDNKNEEAFKEAIEYGLKILDSRYIFNQELSKQQLPPFSYMISMDFGVLDLALVGDYSQIDLFGTIINYCSKINSSSLSAHNEIIIGDNFYRILNSFSNIATNYNFINNGECKITETFGYSTYSINKVNKSSLDENSSITYTLSKKMLGSSTHHLIETKSKKDLYSHKRNYNKRVILVDDEKDILFTYESFLKDNG